MPRPAPTPPITVHDARQEDLAHIVRFQQSMAMETEGKTLDESTLLAGVTAVLASRDLGFYIVAEIGGVVVSSLLITYEWSDWRNSTVWWIQSVYVDAAYRRRGVYTEMHTHVLQRAEDTGGVCGVRLYVDRTNTPAQQTYKKLGMEHSHYDLYETDFTA